MEFHGQQGAQALHGALRVGDSGNLGPRRPGWEAGLEPMEAPPPWAVHEEIFGIDMRRPQSAKRRREEDITPW